MADAGWLTYDLFAGRRGEHFEVTVDDRSRASLELIDATQGTQAGGRGPGGEVRQQFSVVFRGELAPVLPQGSYRVSHAALGQLHLFLVPIGPDSQGMRYEAAFA